MNIKDKIKTLLQNRYLEVHPADDLNECLKKAKTQKVNTIVFRKGNYSSTSVKDSLIYIQNDINIIGYPDEEVIFNGNGKIKHIMVIGPNVTNKTLIANIKIINGNTSLFVENKNFNTKSIYSIIDGAGMLIFGSPVIYNCILEDNFSIMCGGAISIQQLNNIEPVKIFKCKFTNNTANHTGGGIDVLTSSSKLIIKDSTIKYNRSNKISKLGGINGQISVFPKTSVLVEDCIFLLTYSCPIDYSKKATVTLNNNKYMLNKKIIIKEDLSLFSRFRSLFIHIKLLFRILFMEKFRYWILLMVY